MYKMIHIYLKMSSLNMHSNLYDCISFQYLKHLATILKSQNKYNICIKLCKKKIIKWVNSLAHILLNALILVKADIQNRNIMGEM